MGVPALVQPTLIVVSDEPVPMVDAMLELPAIDPPFRSARYRRLEEVSVLLLEPRLTVILYRTSRLDHLQSLLEFHREYRVALRQGMFKIIALNSVEHPQVAELLTRMGCDEIIFLSRAQPRSLKARIQRKFKSWLAPADGLPATNLVQTDPLDLAQDCWLFRGPEDARRLGNYWLIDLMGPGPLSGTWLRIGRSSSLGGIWRWTPLPAPGEAPDRTGSWVFSGRKPEFSDYHWRFKSLAPQLTYFEGKKAIAHRFAIREGGELSVPTNSGAAKSRWPGIRASILAAYHLEPDSSEAPNPFDGRSTRIDGTDWRDFLQLNEKEEHRHQDLFREIERQLAPNQRLFSKVADRAVRLGYLTEISEDQHVAIVWARPQNLRVTLQIDRVDPGSGRLRLQTPAGTSAKDLVRAIREAGAKRVYLNISVKRASLFFMLKLDQWKTDADIIEFALPPDMYEVQRRSFFRAEIPKFPGVWAQLDGLDYRIANLGGGGMGVESERPSEDDLRIGQKIYSIRFELNNEVFQCMGVVRWSKPPLGPRGPYTIGIEFTGIVPTVQQRINLYVLEESFDYLVRSLGTRVRRSD